MLRGIQAGATGLAWGRGAAMKRIAFDLDETPGVPLIESGTIIRFRTRPGCQGRLTRGRSGFSRPWAASRSLGPRGKRISAIQSFAMFLRITQRVEAVAGTAAPAAEQGAGP